jgi:transposase
MAIWCVCFCGMQWRAIGLLCDRALGDFGYRGKRLAEAGQAVGITVEAIARGRDGRFIPVGICWVVERSFAWLSRYRRLNVIFERSKEHLIAFVAIAFISILISAPKAPRRRGTQRLTSTNRH